MSRINQSIKRKYTKLDFSNPDLEGFRDLEEELEEEKKLEELAREVQAELSSTEETLSSNNFSSPNLAQRLSRQKIPIVALILTAIVGYVLIKCMEKVISD